LIERGDGGDVAADQFLAEINGTDELEMGMVDDLANHALSDGAEADLDDVQWIHGR